MGESFAALLEATARQQPEATALVWDGGALTFRDLERRAGGVARALAARGAGRRRRHRAGASQWLALRRGIPRHPEARRHGGAAQPAPVAVGARAGDRAPRAEAADRVGDGGGGGLAGGRLRRAGAHPLHLGQHGRAQGLAALPPRSPARQRVVGRARDGARPRGHGAGRAAPGPFLRPQRRPARPAAGRIVRVPDGALRPRGGARRHRPPSGDGVARRRHDVSPAPRLTRAARRRSLEPAGSRCRARRPVPGRSPRSGAGAPACACCAAMA